MTIAEMDNWFDIIQDKSDSAYFTDSEKEVFLNRAQDKFVRDRLYQVSNPSQQNVQQPSLTVSSLEEESAGLSLIRTIKYSNLDITSDANGFISNSSLNSLLDSTSGQPNNSYMYVLGLRLTSGDVLLKYTRLNDFSKLQQNSFKSATDSYPQYTLGFNGLQTWPQNTKTCKIDLVKTPRAMSIGSSISSELPEETHDYIMAIALADAGIAIREPELARFKLLDK